MKQKMQDASDAERTQRKGRSSSLSVLSSAEHSYSNRIMLCAILAFAIIYAVALLPQANAAATNNLGSYSVKSPRFDLSYTEAVSIRAKTLIAQDIDNPIKSYQLCQFPQGDGLYSTDYTFTVVENPAPGTCDGTPVLMLPGRYQISVQAVDKDGNSTVPYSIDAREFSIVGLKITLVSPGIGNPASGIASTPRFNILFTTGNGSGIPAVCKYSTVMNTSFDKMNYTKEGTTPSVNHQISDISYTGQIYVVCEENGGRQTPKVFTIGYDPSPPSIEVSVIPSRVTDPRKKYATIIANTDDPTYCEISTCTDVKCDKPRPFAFPDGSLEKELNVSTYNTTHEIVNYYSEIDDNDEHVFKHKIMCKNLAGLPTTEAIEVVVNFGEFVEIEVLDPPSVVSTQTFELKVEPTFEANLCDVVYGTTKESMSKVVGTQNQFFSNIIGVVGENSLLIMCYSANKTAKREYNVTVDPTMEVPEPVIDTPIEDPGCTIDDECDDGFVCGEFGECVEKKGHLASWLLILFGLLIMGGAGYFLYDQDSKKRAIKAASETKTKPAQQFNPKRGFVAPTINPDVERIRREQMARRAAMHETFEKRVSEKNAKRSSFFNVFDNLVEGNSQQGGVQNPDAGNVSSVTSSSKDIFGPRGVSRDGANNKVSETASVAGTNSQDDTPDDAENFVDISALKSKGNLKPIDDIQLKNKDVKTGKNTTDKKSAFDDLDKLTRK